MRRQRCTCRTCWGIPDGSKRKKGVIEAISVARGFLCRHGLHQQVMAIKLRDRPYVGHAPNKDWLTGSCLIVVRKMISNAVIVAVHLRETEYNVELRRQDTVDMITDATLGMTDVHCASDASGTFPAGEPVPDRLG